MASWTTGRLIISGAAGIRRAPQAQSMKGDLISPESMVGSPALKQKRQASAAGFRRRIGNMVVAV